MYNYKIVVCLHVYAFVYKMLRLIAKGIIRSYSMRQRRIVGGLMFNAQRYMHVNDAYFAPSMIQFPYELKKIFDLILHGLQYLDKVHPHLFTLDLDQLDKIFDYRAGSSSSFPVTNVELEYMFDTLSFLWLYHDSPPYLLYLLEKLVDGLSDGCVRLLRSTATTAL